MAEAMSGEQGFLSYEDRYHLIQQQNIKLRGEAVSVISSALRGEPHEGDVSVALQVLKLLRDVDGPLDDF